jgi:hypothetical protein
MDINDDHLPPELRAMNEAMKMIFNAAPQETAGLHTSAGTISPGMLTPAVSAPDRHDLRNRLQALYCWRDEAQHAGRVKEVALTGALITEYEERL